MNFDSSRVNPIDNTTLDKIQLKTMSTCLINVIFKLTLFANEMNQLVVDDRLAASISEIMQLVDQIEALLECTPNYT